MAVSSDINSNQDQHVAIRWTAPEYFKHKKFTFASDVYSFAITMWEIFTCADLPYGQWRANAEVIEQVIHGYRMPIPDNCPDAIYQLMAKCWDNDPEKRPSFEQISNTLLKLINSILETPHKHQIHLKSTENQVEEVGPSVLLSVESSNQLKNAAYSEVVIDNNESVNSNNDQQSANSNKDQTSRNSQDEEEEKDSLYQNQS